MAFAFDPLAYAKRLRDAGIPSQQAEAHAEAARECIMAELITKPDLAAVRDEVATTKRDLRDEVVTTRLDLRDEMATTKRDLQASDATTRRELEQAMDTLSLRLTVRLGIMLAAGLSLMTAILGALMRFH
jgi:hypothetical protein